MEDDQINYHAKRAIALQKSHNIDGFMQDKGNLMARVFIRATASGIDKKGNYIIHKSDLFNWFENGDYLHSKKEIDTI